MESILAFLVLFYLIAFAYDKTIDNEIKGNQALANKLTEFKYFHSFQSRPKALSCVLSFKFFGISTALNIVGSVFSLMMYFGLVVGLYLLVQ
ncbi:MULTISPECIES: hypothetical protein [Colwellia]|jgi:hypothetical protein|uniref:Uncharacterized protein n=1 Tax=Colwellia psychrerythraea (strain 34H / ATCC BAA-681) TaxID=167879 RepID=Q482X7_COLP3|nr:MULTISPECIES: hypothetical protein [Colwellia]AAZ24579.1 hypothetical protein CPS_2165 [Colwellia psychrerythraea 34H]PKH87930.1 hypothetical protein CXF79_15055 [Colwellia sp. Bg11-28]